MNFIRKLKLNSLGQYEFSKKELDIINNIKSLNIKNLNFIQIQCLYKIMCLNLIIFDELENNNDVYFSDNERNIYFLYNKKYNQLWWSYYRVESFLKLNLFLFNSDFEKIIVKIMEKSYKIKKIKLKNEIGYFKKEFDYKHDNVNVNLINQIF